MLKITDKPKYTDFRNTDEIMEMFRHVIFSDCTLEWISGALAYIDTQRVHNQALHKAIDVWFSENEEDKESFKELFEMIHKATFLKDFHNRLRRESETDEL